MFQDAATTSFPALPLTSLQNGTPALAYSVGSSPDWGATIGDTFNDVDVRTYLQAFTRIAEVQLRGSASFVEQIITTYEDETGNLPPIKHGGEAGNLTLPLRILPGQGISSIRAKTDPKTQSLLKAVQIILSDGRGILAGSNEGTAQPKWDTPNGSIVMGFHGRARNGTGSIAFVYQIGVDYATLKPATWKAVPQ